MIRLITTISVGIRLKIKVGVSVNASLEVLVYKYDSKDVTSQDVTLQIKNLNKIDCRLSTGHNFTSLYVDTAYSSM